MKKIDLRKISVVAIFCALAYISVFLFKFKVSFLTFDLKDTLLAVTAFIFGPLYALASTLVVTVLEFLTVSDTGIYGLIMNFLSSATFCLCCGLLYRFKRTLKGGIIATVTAVFAMTAIMLLANLFITPYYMGVNISQVAQMIPTLLLPFNLIKGIFNASVTMLIYKPITVALRKVKLLPKHNNDSDVGRFTVLTIVAVFLIILSVFIIFSLLNGSFSFLEQILY